MVNRPPYQFDPEYVATLRKILDEAVEQRAENRTPQPSEDAQTIERRRLVRCDRRARPVTRAVRAGQTPAA